ncbi:SCO family protein [Ramlibacter sp. AW1]|uniref:SCO family protein n=1 Tax=Ramlibacter aurantiacus TaxID=2801330 RepID=A0A936ZLT9_9BURK|nr:SCO family protein [Ramlibacter aurantiacus]
MTRTGTAIALALLLAACGEPPGTPAAGYHAVDIRAVDWGRDFRMTDHAGQVRSLRDFKGKVVMMFFGFTQCPDICPSTMADMAQAVNQLGGSAAEVQGLFVTVDPARDTPEVLAKYVTGFHPSFLGLRANEQSTQALADEFKAFYAARRPAPAPDSEHRHGDTAPYMVDHTRAVYVFDRKGKLTLLITSGRTVDEIAADLNRLLRE